MRDLQIIEDRIKNFLSGIFRIVAGQDDPAG